MENNNVNIRNYVDNALSKKQFLMNYMEIREVKELPNKLVLNKINSRKNNSYPFYKKISKLEILSDEQNL